MNLRLVSLSGPTGCGKDAAGLGLASLGWSTLGWSSAIRAITMYAWPQLTNDQVDHDRNVLLPAPMVLDLGTMRRLTHGMTLVLNGRVWPGPCYDLRLREWFDSLDEEPRFETMRAWQQFFGTEMVRLQLDPNLWVDNMRHVVRSATSRLDHRHAYITGTRYDNERAMLIEPEFDGLLVYVTRPGHEYSGVGIAGHSSESSYGRASDYHVHLANNGTVEQLQDALVRIVLHFGRLDSLPPRPGLYGYVESCWTSVQPLAWQTDDGPLT